MVLDVEFSSNYNYNYNFYCFVNISNLSNICPDPPRKETVKEGIS